MSSLEGSITLLFILSLEKFLVFITKKGYLYQLHKQKGYLSIPQVFIYSGEEMPTKELFTDKEIAILKIVQDNIPDSPMPFWDIAKKVGISEYEVISFLEKLKKNGFIRRFGATLKHQVAGYDCNVMVAWRVEPEEKIEQIGQIFINRPEITHCYIRRTYPSWPYNLYTMIHGRCEEECLSLVKKIKKETGLEDFQLLFSDEELKKTSMKYF
jgi:DNA-binding Lrp family transcriptional regulator